MSEVPRPSKGALDSLSAAPQVPQVTTTATHSQRLSLGPRAISAVGAGILLAIIVLGLVDRSARVLGWFIAALVAATLLASIIEYLERWIGHRGAVGLTAAVVLICGALVSFRIIEELQRELLRLRASVPAGVVRLESSPRFGNVVRGFDLRTKTDQFLNDLPNRLGGGSAADTARLAGSRASAFLAGTVLTCFLCAGGRRSFHAMLGWFPHRQGQLINRHSLGQMLERSHRRLRTMMLFSVARASASGLLIGLLFGLVGIPAPTFFGLLFAVCSIVPGIGAGAAGFVSLGAVVLFTSDATTWLCAVAVIGVTALNYLIMRRALRGGMLNVGPAVGLAGFIIGAELGGIGTALCVFFGGGFLAALWTEFVRLKSFAEGASLAENGDSFDARGLASNSSSTTATTGRSVERTTRPTEMSSYAQLVVTTGSLWVLTRTGLGIAGQASATLLLILIALIVALAIEQIIAPICRKVSDNRKLAVGSFGLVLVLMFAVVTVLVAPIVSNKAKSFGAEIPELTNRLANLPFIGGRLRDADVPGNVERWLANLPDEISRNSSQVSETLWGASDMILNVVLTVMMAFAFVLDGPRLLASARRALKPKARRTFDQSGRLVIHVVGRYFAGSLLVASMAGVVALVVGLSLGVILAPVAALWIAATNLIPQVGGFLGGSVLVVLGFTTSTTVGVLCLGYFLLYQQIENHLIQPAIIGRAVSLSPAATMMIALIGGSAIGVPGALIAIPVVGAVKTVVRHVAGERAPSEQ